MKKPLVWWTCGSVCRNSGRRRWPNRGHSSARLSSISRPEASTTASLSSASTVQTEKTHRATRADARRRSPQELELELRQRLATPAKVGPGRQDAEPRARRIHERAIEAGQVGRQITAVGPDDAHLTGAEQP